jgi:integrase
VKERLTDEKIAALGPAPAGKRLDIFDTVLPGLVVRVTDKGVKSFAVRYRHGSRTLRYTIGKTPPLKLKKAREIAHPLLATARQGANPMDEKRAKKSARDRSPACEKVVERFIKHQDKKVADGDLKPSHAAEVARLLRKQVAKPWKARTLASIEAEDVATLLDELSSLNTKRHTFFALRSLFKWAKGVRIIDSSPIGEDFPTPAKPTDRERVLEERELKSVWRTVIGTYSTYHAIVQLLMVTAQRRDEVAEAEWSEFDLAKAVWTIPAKRTKNRKTHRVPLTALATQIIRNIPRTDPILLFPGQAKEGKAYREGQSRRKTFSGWSRSKRRLDDCAGVRDWRLHDLRRTAVTWMATAGVEPHVVERIINHSSGEISGVAAIYNRATYEKKMRDALERWSLYLAKPLPPWVVRDKDEVLQAIRGHTQQAKAMVVNLAAPKDSQTACR